MRVALFSSYVPFVNGGARFIVEWLEQKLLEYGHQVERVYLPLSDSFQDLLCQMTVFRSVKIHRADRVICFRPPAYLLQHPNKVLWFIHHFRGFYDLWGTAASPPATGYYKALRHAVLQADSIALREARMIFTNSRVVQKRLKDFNNVDSSVLYPPLLAPTVYRNMGYGDEVVYLSRLVSHKRQHLMVEAMAHVKTKVKARICGEDLSGEYAEELTNLVSRFGLGHRVSIENRWISEQEKCEIIGRSLAVAYFPLDEDSYGYPTLEAAHSEKPVLTTTDSGGVLEFVAHERNGLVCDSNAQAIGESLDRLYSDRALAESLGNEAQMTVEKLRIDWDNVVDHLLG
ncbi:MAG: glycosyltransferase family 4 protein [Verrucomicrobia bacterium]|nr:glycosyltransferase family 4 protein [Verrucomicrobiota bacterium]MBV8377426.1 glycosyltransferase family 4 protein [Verrucomicrobiota bacterium]